MRAFIVGICPMGFSTGISRWYLCTLILGMMMSALTTAGAPAEGIVETEEGSMERPLEASFRRVRRQQDPLVPPSQTLPPFDAPGPPQASPSSASSSPPSSSTSSSSPSPSSSTTSPSSHISVLLPDTSIHSIPPMLPPMDTMAIPNSTLKANVTLTSSTANASTHSSPDTHGAVFSSTTTTAIHPAEPPSLNKDPNDHQFLSQSLRPSVQNDGPVLEALNHAMQADHQYHQTMSSSVEPTLAPMEEFYPTNTMDVDWGSGDYLETMSFMGSEGDDYPMVTNLPSQMYDFEDSNSEAYDTSFPTRVAFKPSGTLLTKSPQATRAHPQLDGSRSLVSVTPVQPFVSMTPTSSISSPIPYDSHVTSSLKPMTTSLPPAFPIPTTTSYSRPARPPPSQATPVPSGGYTTFPTFPPGVTEAFTNFSNINASGSSSSRPSVVVHLPGSPPIRSVPSAQDSMSTPMLDWADGVTVQPTDLLLPDMNSLEYFTIQQTKETSSVLEQGPGRTSPTIPSLSSSSTPALSASDATLRPTPVMTTGIFTTVFSPSHTTLFGEELLPTQNISWSEETSADTSGYEVPGFPTLEPDVLTLQPNMSFLDPSAMLTPSMEPTVSTVLWSQGGGSDWTSTPSVAATQTQPMSVQPSASANDQWDFTPMSSVTLTTQPSPLTPSLSPSSPVTLPPISSLPDTNVSVFTLSPTESAPNATVVPLPIEPLAPNASYMPYPTDMADEAVTFATPSDNITATVNIFTATTVNSTAPDVDGTTGEVGTMAGTVPPPAVMTTNPDFFLPTTAPHTPAKPPTIVTSKPPETTTAREYVCSLTKPENYLVKVGLPSGSTAGYAKAKVREILKPDFNQSLELQVLKAPPDFVFRVVSGPIVYTAISIVNALRQSPRASRSILYATLINPMPGPQYHVHTVLQFVPSHVDVRTCMFSERIENGLTAAFAEVRRRAHESTNFTVQIVNITVGGLPKATRQQRAPVDVVFAVRDARGYLQGAALSSHLRALNMVEFSYYLGLPVLQIAEPFHYPELNVTQLLRSSWVRTVVLGVLEPRVTDRTFQAKMERRLAQLLGEALGIRRVRRATSVGNNSVQIVRTTRLPGPESPLEMIYFVERTNGERLPAVTTATTLNRLDVQRAAIVLGYRVQGILAQPYEKIPGFPSPPSEPSSTWVAVGVVVPVLVVVLVIAIVYWKFCRTDKLEFQPDTMVTGPQRQKPQTPSVKGFDFAKLHLGQPSKSDLTVIQEPGASLPPSIPTKDTSTSESGEPAAFSSSKNAARAAGRKKGRISPSDGDSVTSDRSSERDSPAGHLRGPAPPHDSRHTRKITNGLNGPPPLSGPDDQLSSASIFEHVDRMSRPGESGPKRFANKIQLIAMQPMPALPTHTPAVLDPATRAAESAKLNKEIQVALRHKSEIEHHRNKIRLRAKRKGHYDFPTMDELTESGAGDVKEQEHIYQKAKQQIDKILDPDIRLPPPFTEPKKSSRGRRSPKSKKVGHLNGGFTEADRDQLISKETDGTYRKYPGVSNFAYVSDPDQAPEPRDPSPSDDVFLSPGSPPPYLPPQPSIEEARQQMHSLLDDAFALVSPSTLAPPMSTPTTTPTAPPTSGITLPGLGNGHPHPHLPSSSPPSRGPPRSWVPTFPTPGAFSGVSGLDRLGFNENHTPAYSRNVF